MIFRMLLNFLGLLWVIIGVWMMNKVGDPGVPSIAAVLAVVAIIGGITLMAVEIEDNGE